MIDKILLFPYYLWLQARNARYAKGRHSRSAEVPTICVGNVTAGGTGKTPHVEMILRMLLESDEWGARNIAVLSRGYKRSSRGFQQVSRESNSRLAGDEPLQIKRKFPSVTVAVDKDRIEGCDLLCHPEKMADRKVARSCRNREWNPADLIVLDDAFQYRKLKASLNIVLVDYNRPPHKDKLLPLGRLRDLPSRLEEADILIITKCPYQLEDAEKGEFLHEMGFNSFDPAHCDAVGPRGRHLMVLFSCTRYLSVSPMYAASDPRYIYSKRVIVFSAIANDTPLRYYLSDTYKIAARFAFPDHHRFTDGAFRKILREVDSCPTAAVLTTEKDAQRVLDIHTIPERLRDRMFYIPIESAFLSEQETALVQARLRALR